MWAGPPTWWCWRPRHARSLHHRRRPTRRPRRTTRCAGSAAGASCRADRVTPRRVLGLGAARRFSLRHRWDGNRNEPLISRVENRYGGGLQAPGRFTAGGVRQLGDTQGAVVDRYGLGGQRLWSRAVDDGTVGHAVLAPVAGALD